MIARAGRPAVVPPSLARLRLRLTVWYAATFFAILALLGGGMFAAITRRFDNELDASLRDASRELVREASIEVASGRPDEAVEIARILRIPERRLYLTDTAGRSLTAVPVDDWLRRLAARASRADSASATHVIGDRILRAHAQRFELGPGRMAVALASGDEVELEDRYTALIVAFTAAALVSVILVAGGGYLLARKSTAPVEQAIEHMRRFMADAAHELRTPLTVMRSRAEVALSRPREAESYVAALQSVERETIHLARIVDDLLTLARADAGQRPIQRSRVFLDDVMLDAADAARAIAAPKSVEIQVVAFEEAPVAGDPQLLRQLVMILLDNAVKFTGPNGVVRAGVALVDAAPTLTVSDTGIGIGTDQLPHVFERFYRGDSARSRDAGRDGVGLGLSIAQWIVEAHGGSIRMDSRAGQGTRVVVQFPPVASSLPVSSS
ncbi:MAG TPA: ATP-binding protein [Gemmatimonadaceae bacterium]|nr:ATP-binding protein [Gemmatimonadaceae bacterium]